MRPDAVDGDGCGHWRISENDLMMIWERCEGRCAVSGHEFSLEQIGNGRPRCPFAPSLDQIEPGKGYRAGNLRLVCVAVNFGINSWGVEVYLRLAASAAAKAATDNGGSDKAWYARQDEKIKAAERELRSLSGGASESQRRRIASLKRARKLGPAGLRRAALSAASSRLRVPPQNHVGPRR
jgi:hypothetical protein